MSTIQKVTYYDPMSSNPVLPVSGNTPFGFYDGDGKFVQDVTNFLKFAYYRIGGGVLDVELKELNYYASYEDAVNVYGKEIYEYKIRENYLNLEGSPTGSSNLNTTLIQPNLGTIIRLARDYGSEAGSGGNVTYYSGSIPCKMGQQYYDLDYWASASGYVENGDTIEVKKIFYEAVPPIVRFFDPYIGTGVGLNNLLGQFGFNNMSPGISFQLMPVYFDVQTIQAIEFNDQIRRSAYTFRLDNNKLRIFPIPAYDFNLWFTYIKNSERNAAYRTTTSGLITNVSNVPYDVPVYSQINAPGIQWIRSYALANCKETVGLVRGKYSSQPFPGTQISVNGQDFTTQGVNEKQALIDQLRATLEATSRSAQLAKKNEEAENMMNTLNKVPLAIYVM